MAFVLPAGDYERALRMAGASNFMEALEAGIDRGMQRQAMRERAARARDLYNRQVASQQADLMEDLLEIDSAGFTAGQPTVAAPATGQAVAVSPTTGQVIAAEGASVAAPRAAAPSPTAAALAEAVSPAPSQGEYSMPADTRAIHDRMRANRMARRKQPPVGTVTTDDQMVMRIKRNPVTSALERGLPASEFALATPRGPRVLDDPNPDMYEVWRAPYVVDTASLPPQEFALATPRQSEQLAEALRLAEQGRTVEAQEVLGATGAAYPPLDVETATEGPLIPFEAGQDALPEEAPAAPAEGGDGVVGLPTGGPGAFATQAAGVTAALSDDPVLAAVRSAQLSPVERMRQQAEARLQDSAEYGVPLSALDEALSAGGLTTVVPSRIPDNPAPEDLYRALGQDTLAAHKQFKARSPEEMLGIAPRDEGVDQTTQQEQRRLQGFEENALGAGSMAMGDLGFGTTPGTPLEQAFSKRAAVAEEVELAGPEPEAVKADQTVDVAGKVYTVKKGDTLGRVSSSFGAPLASVVAANQDVLAPGGKPRQIKRGEKVLLEGQDLIYPGDRIRIPTGEGRETGGEAGPVDPRPVTTVTGPGGQVTSSEGVLARVQRANKTNAQVKAALEKEQRKTPDLPLNPFQKFGRAIDYTPSLKAVAFATLRAQQGDFTMLNQLAGRQVRNSEIPGLFAEYSEFVRGAKGRAKEVYLQQELLKETQANEAKLRALTGVKAMALTQFRRAGYIDEDAQVFAGHYADLYAADPQQARAWSTSLNSMGSDRAKAEAARLKRSGFRSKTGLSRKDLMDLRKERRALKKDRAAIAGKMEASLREAQLMGDEEQIARIQESTPYIALLREYRDSDAMLAEINAELGYTEDTDDDDGEPEDYVKSTIANQSVIDLAKNFSGDMDSFESGIERRLKAAGDPKSAENAKLVREHFEKSQAEQAQFVSALPRGGADILGEEGLPEFRKARAASLPTVEKRVENLLNRVKELRVSAARGSSSQRGDVMDELRDIADKIDRDRAEIKDITGKDPGDIARPARALLRRISLAERPTDRAAFEGGF